MFSRRSVSHNNQLAPVGEATNFLDRLVNSDLKAKILDVSRYDDINKVNQARRLIRELEQETDLKKGTQIAWTLIDLYLSIPQVLSGFKHKGELITTPIRLSGGVYVDRTKALAAAAQDARKFNKDAREFDEIAGKLISIEEMRALINQLLIMGLLDVEAYFKKLLERAQLKHEENNSQRKLIQYYVRVEVTVIWLLSYVCLGSIIERENKGFLQIANQIQIEQDFYIKKDTCPGFKVFIPNQKAFIDLCGSLVNVASQQFSAPCPGDHSKIVRGELYDVVKYTPDHLHIYNPSFIKLIMGWMISLLTLQTLLMLWRFRNKVEQRVVDAYLLMFYVFSLFLTWDIVNLGDITHPAEFFSQWGGGSACEGYGKFSFAIANSTNEVIPIHGKQPGLFPSILPESEPVSIFFSNAFRWVFYLAPFWQFIALAHIGVLYLGRMNKIIEQAKISSLQKSIDTLHILSQQQTPSSPQTTSQASSQTLSLLFDFEEGSNIADNKSTSIPISTF